jgi:AcrR family transcriptional regulator
MDKNSTTVKSRIRAAAALLFQEKGYTATSMRELAQKVGLEASSLYNYFRSKDQILSEICMQNSSHFIDGIALIQRECVESIEKMKAVIRLHIRVAADDPASVTVFNDEWKHLNESDKKEFLRRRKRYEESVFSIINEGIQKQEFNAIDPRIGLITFLSALKGIHYWFKPGKMNTDQLAAEMESILLQGFRKTN